jgi:outer membrane biosynthesis protein TonB
MQLLAAKFNQIDATIEAKNAQIIALQAEVTELQEHRQQLLSVEQACQSVLSQADTAIVMLGHVDPSQIATLRDALAAKFNPAAIGILEPATITEPEPAPEPTEPDAPVGDTPEPEADAPIDVEVSTEPEPTTATEPGPAPEPDIEQQLSKMPLPTLRMLAKSKSVDARGTKANLAARLKGLVTPTDLRAIS